MNWQTNQDSSAIKALLVNYHQAMIAADTVTLQKLLCTDFNLEHITGYQQPRLEWLNQIQSRYFTFHHIAIDTPSPTLFVQSPLAVIVGKATFTVSINGSCSPWRLQFVLNCVKDAQNWLIAHAQYAACGFVKRETPKRAN